MSECEHVFLSARQILANQRNWLLYDIIDANEYLPAWRRVELF